MTQREQTIEQILTDIGSLKAAIRSLGVSAYEPSNLSLVAKAHVRIAEHQVRMASHHAERTVRALYDVLDCVRQEPNR